MGDVFWPNQLVGCGFSVCCLSLAFLPVHGKQSYCYQGAAEICETLLLLKTVMGLILYIDNTCALLVLSYGM